METDFRGIPNLNHFYTKIPTKQNLSQWEILLTDGTFEYNFTFLIDYQCSGAFIRDLRVIWRATCGVGLAKENLIKMFHHCSNGLVIRNGIKMLCAF